MNTCEILKERLIDEMNHNISGGIYNKLQVDFAYNTNHIEGSRLSHDQTRYIFDTQTLSGDNIDVNDVIETVNHFNCFKYVLNTINEDLSEDYIKKLHYILKSGTLSASSKEAVVGDYKKYSNEVAGISTTKPNNVSVEISKLLDSYNLSSVGFEEIISFHVYFEKIHPFYDGNGRVGRLIMFKECLRNNIIPFIINDSDKLFYYKGLKEWQEEGKKTRLQEVCRLMQDDMKAILDYFEITDSIPSNDPGDDDTNGMRNKNT